MAPNTFRAEAAHCSGIDWNGHGSVCRAGSGGVFHMFRSLHHGTFAERVAMVARMNESERAGLVIEKAGDREFGPGEVLELYKCANFPR